MAAYFIEAGLLLTIAPWTGLWDRNYFAAHWPWLRVWMGIGLVRGAVSATGVVTAIGGMSDLYTLFARPTARFEPPPGPSAP